MIDWYTKVISIPLYKIKNSSNLHHQLIWNDPLSNHSPTCRIGWRHIPHRRSRRPRRLCTALILRLCAEGPARGVVRAPGLLDVVLDGKNDGKSDETMGKTPDIMILWHFLGIVFPGNMEYYWGGSCTYSRSSKSWNGRLTNMWPYKLTQAWGNLCH